MPATIDLTQDQLFIDVRSVIVGLIPGSPEVITGLVNRVPMPKNPFIAVSPVSRTRIATNTETFTDTGATHMPPDNIGGTVNAQQSTKFDLQIDCYGPLSGDWAQILSTFFRSSSACELMTVGKPLYADDPVQLPLINGEQQYEERWIVRAAFQFNPTVSTLAEFADTLGPVNIYPPGDLQ